MTVAGGDEAAQQVLLDVFAAGGVDVLPRAAQGKVSFAQRKGPLRDLTHVREAADNLKQLVQLFPKSPYTKEGNELLDKCLEDLAQHELLIAQYYANIGAWQGAKQRLEFLFANYPDTATAKAAAPLMEQGQERFRGPATPPPTPAPAKRSADQH